MRYIQKSPLIPPFAKGGKRRAQGDFSGVGSVIVVVSRLLGHYYSGFHAQ
jgi:hypothetical protein